MVLSKKGDPKLLKMGRPPAGLWCVLAIRNATEGNPTPGAPMIHEIGIARSERGERSQALCLSYLPSHQL